MILTKDELLNAVKTNLGDITTDDAIKLLEDISDTLSDKPDVSAKDNEIKSLKQQISDTDKMWRDKYTERFFSKSADTPVVTAEPIEPQETPNQELSIDDLFTDK